MLGEILAGDDRATTTGRPTRIVASLGSTVAFDALARGRDRRLRRLLRHDLGDDHEAHATSPPDPARRARRGRALPRRDARHRAGRARSASRTPTRSRCATRPRGRLGITHASATSRRTRRRSRSAATTSSSAAPSGRRSRARYGLALPRAAQHGPVADVPGASRARGRRDQRVLDRRPDRRLGLAVLERRPPRRSRPTTRWCSRARALARDAPEVIAALARARRRDRRRRRCGALNPAVDQDGESPARSRARSWRNDVRRRSARTLSRGLTAPRSRLAERRAGKTKRSRRRSPTPARHQRRHVEQALRGLDLGERRARRRVRRREERAAVLVGKDRRREGPDALRLRR